MNQTHSNAALTPKQLQFCREYILDLNGTQAAIRAGYSERAARQIATENLSKPSIQAEIARLRAGREQRLEITAERVLEELAYLAFADPETEEGRHALAKTIEVRTHPNGKTTTTVQWRQESKTKALELLGRHMALFAKNELELPGGLTIRVVRE